MGNMYFAFIFKNCKRLALLDDDFVEAGKGNDQQDRPDEDVVIVL